MEMTLEQITADMSVDETPAGPDGCSNVDRIRFAMQVLKLPVVDLTTQYNFLNVVGNRDVNEVEAVKHILLLKMDYTRRCFEAGLLDVDTYRFEHAERILCLQRLNWHLLHLRQGTITPPFPAFH